MDGSIGSSSYDGGGWMRGLLECSLGEQPGGLVPLAPEADLSDSSSSSSRGGGGGSGAGPVHTPGRLRPQFDTSTCKQTYRARDAAEQTWPRPHDNLPDNPRMTRKSRGGSMRSTSLAGVNWRCSTVAGADSRHVECDIPRAYCRTAEEREGSLESDRACCSTKGRPTTRG